MFKLNTSYKVVTDAKVLPQELSRTLNSKKKWEGERRVIISIVFCLKALLGTLGPSLCLT